MKYRTKDFFCISVMEYGKVFWKAEMVDTDLEELYPLMEEAIGVIPRNIKNRVGSVKVAFYHKGRSRAEFSLPNCQFTSEELSCRIKSILDRECASKK